MNRSSGTRRLNRSSGTSIRVFLSKIFIMSHILTSHNMNQDKFFFVLCQNCDKKGSSTELIIYYHLYIISTIIWTSDLQVISLSTSPLLFSSRGVTRKRNNKLIMVYFLFLAFDGAVSTFWTVIYAICPWMDTSSRAAPARR